MAKKRTHCKACGQRVGPMGEVVFTRKGLHIACAVTRAVEAAEQIERREGPMYEKWRDGMVKAGLRPQGTPTP